MINFTTEAGTPTLVTASSLVRRGRGVLLGIFCSVAKASSKIAFSDASVSAASAAVGLIVAAFSVTPTKQFIPMRMTFTNGLYASLSGSAQQTTVIVEPL